MGQNKPSIRPRVRVAGDDSRTVERVALDIVDIRALQAEMAALGPVELTSEQFSGEAESVDEFLGHGRTSLEHLRIESRSTDVWRSLSVTMDRERAHIFTHGDDDHLLAGVQLRVEQILRGRSRVFAVFVSHMTFPLGLAAFAALSVIASLMETSDSAGATVPSEILLLPAALGILALVGWIVSKTAQGEILLVPREERPGWMKRNRDSLMVQVLGGVVVLIAGIAIGRLI